MYILRINNKNFKKLLIKFNNKITHLINLLLSFNLLLLNLLFLNFNLNKKNLNIFKKNSLNFKLISKKT